MKYRPRPESTDRVEQPQRWRAHLLWQSVVFGTSRKTLHAFHLIVLCIAQYTDNFSSFAVVVKDKHHNRKSRYLWSVGGDTIFELYGEGAMYEGNVRKWYRLFKEDTTNTHDEERSLWSWTIWQKKWIQRFGKAGDPWSLKQRNFF